MRLTGEADLGRLRRRLRTLLPNASPFVLTRILTVASELGRNVLVHGGGGRCDILPPAPDLRLFRLRFADEGPGIVDIERALGDGYSTNGGLGLGLGGARRLSETFHIDSAPGRGTRIRVALPC